MLSGRSLAPSPPSEKATARQYQTGKTSAGDGAGHGGDRVVSVRYKGARDAAD